MNITLVPISDLYIPPDRQRKEFNENAVVELATSIARSGLLHPVVIRRDSEGRTVLVAGERRIKALDILWNTGQPVRCGRTDAPEGQVPCLYIGELDPIDAFEAELDENIRRADLSWQERAQAVQRLYSLRAAQATRGGDPAPIAADIAEEVHGTRVGGAATQVKEQLMAARFLEDPDVAKAPSLKEAVKIIKRKEEVKRHEALGRTVGEYFTAALHRLDHADCLELLPKMEAGYFDVILSDPPYGISADEFGDSGQRTAGAHFYDDSFEAWMNLMIDFIPQTFRIAKPQAHMYLFCDVDHFVELKDLAFRAGWKVFRTPIIWHNPTSMRAPWPEHGPQRKYQMVLYAQKGNRPVTRLYPDIISIPSDDNLGHQAQKPAELYRDLLRRSVRPGDSVIDPFCGSGTIFPACHDLQCRATGIEIDAAAYGIAVTRLNALEGVK